MMRALVLVALALGACAPTEIIVSVTSNISPTELTAVQLSIGDANADAQSMQGRTCVCVGASCSDPVSFPLEIPLVPGTQGGAPFSIAVTGHADQQCYETEFIDNHAAPVMFEEHKRLSLTLDLTQACVGISCPANETCESGTCVSQMKMLGTNTDLSSPVVTPDGGRGHADGGGSATPDLRVSLPDLGVTVNKPFIVLNAAPTVWDVASEGTDFYMGWITGAGNLDFYNSRVIDAIKDTTAHPLANPTTTLCATASNDVLPAVEYFLAEQGGTSRAPTWSLFLYGGTTVPQTALFPSVTGTVSALQCTTDTSDIFLGALVSPPAEQLNPATSLFVGTYAASPGASSIPPKAAFGATSFVLSRSGPPGILAVPASAVTNEEPSIDGGTTSGCTTKYTLYFGWNGVNHTNTGCIPGVVGEAYALASGQGSYYEAFYETGTGADGTSVVGFGTSYLPTMLSPAQSAMTTTSTFGLLAMIDEAGQVEAFGISSAAMSPVLTEPHLIASNADTTKPVKIAYASNTNLVLIMWVDATSGALMAVIGPPIAQ